MIVQTLLFDFLLLMLVFLKKKMIFLFSWNVAHLMRLVMSVQIFT